MSFPSKIDAQSLPIRPRMPRAVWILGWVSLFTDVSSELAHALLPLLLVGGMGASVMIDRKSVV